MIYLVKVLSRLKLLKYFNLAVKVGGVVVPIKGRLVFVNTLCDEMWMTDILKILLKLTDGCFVDVGANIGQTLIKLRMIGGDVKYIGFEPNSTCVSYVEELIERNSFENCEIIPVGISNTNEIIPLDLYSKDPADSSASIVADFRTNQRVYRRKNVVVLNSHLISSKLDPKVGILKIDVEGAELSVIEGIRDVIGRDRPFVVLEILPVYADENIQRLSRQMEIEEIFKKMAYKILRVRKRENNAFDHFEEIASIGIHSDLKQCDYVLVPYERNAEVVPFVKVPTGLA